MAHEPTHTPDTAGDLPRPHNKAFWRAYRRYLRLIKHSDSL
ncbi:hypothetical protein [Pyrobaculum islandicum]|nr:hypothetical protein [Pyrobaculum islandicum]